MKRILLCCNAGSLASMVLNPKNGLLHGKVLAAALNYLD
jgi:cellobiose-specific phosphotransferase system component IIB